MRSADLANPFATYKRLRDEAPVHWAQESGVFCISRYEDVSHVLTSPNVFSSTGFLDVMVAERWKKLGWRELFEMARFVVRARMSPLEFKSGLESVILVDPPRHGELRGILNRGFTPRRISAWEERTREITNTCLAPLRRGESFDIVQQFSIPLPVTVIAEMLGVESERQLDFKRWSDEIVAGASGSGTLADFLRAMGELHTYLRPIVAERRRHPAEDMISVLVDPSNDETLDAKGMVQFVILLLIAGNETTTNLLGNAVTALLRNPDQLALVRDDPSLVPALVEETLRYESPLQMVFRKVMEDTEIRGTTLQKGSSVCALLGSANRDERQFPDPDRFDLQRDARRHVALGKGIHFCLGAPLGRLEARVALEELVPLLGERDSVELDPPMIDSYIVRGRARLLFDEAPRVSHQKNT
jgi:cytochrome P450